MPEALSTRDDQLMTALGELVDQVKAMVVPQHKLCILALGLGEAGSHLCVLYSLLSLPDSCQEGRFQRQHGVQLPCSSLKVDQASMKLRMQHSQRVGHSRCSSGPSFLTRVTFVSDVCSDSLGVLMQMGSATVETFEVLHLQACLEGLGAGINYPVH